MTFPQTRRRFLKTSLLASAATGLSPLTRLVPPPAVPEHIGLQLYSLRDVLPSDPASTLAAVAKMGYKEVEAYDFQKGDLFGLSYADFGKTLKDNGLSMYSTHAGLSLADYDARNNDIRDSVKKWVDAAPGLGLRYLISPSIADSDRQNMRQMVQLYTAMGRYCQKAGLRFAHHNHEYEFSEQSADKRLLIEWLLQEIDPTLITFEMDLCWVVYARNNPLDWFRLYPGRWELCHAKDLEDYDNRVTIEVGDGVIDFKPIFQKSQEAGLRHYVVELEHYRTTPLQGVERARDGLLKMF